MATIEFYGLFDDVLEIEVSYWAEYPRGVDGMCAFCHGDPIGERSETSRIAEFLKAFSQEEHCPVCLGRPT